MVSSAKLSSPLHRHLPHPGLSLIAATSRLKKRSICFSSRSPVGQAIQLPSLSTCRTGLTSSTMSCRLIHVQTTRRHWVKAKSWTRLSSNRWWLLVAERLPITTRIQRHLSIKSHVISGRLPATGKSRSGRQHVKPRKVSSSGSRML